MQLSRRLTLAWHTSQVEKVDDADSGKRRPMTMIESVYFAVATFSTVGYGVPAPITDAGKVSVSPEPI